MNNNTYYAIGESHNSNHIVLGRFRKDVGAMTAQIWTDDKWQSSNNYSIEDSENSNLVVSVGEIDIRGHFWRHIPRDLQNNPNLTIQEWIDKRTHSIVSTLIDTAIRGKWHKVIYLAPPTAGYGENNNWPFSGSIKTRNILIDMFNRSMIKLIKTTGPEICMVTAYYDYIDNTTYLNSANYSKQDRDGVHWPMSMESEMWKLITNVDKIYVGPNYIDDRVIHPKISIEQLDKISRFDSWINVSSIKNLDRNTDRIITFEQQEYVYIQRQDIHRINDVCVYYELCLTL